MPLQTVTDSFAHDALIANYERLGWPQVEPIGDDGVVAVAGPGGVTFHGRAVRPVDIDDPEFKALVKRLAATRMPTGQLCPLDLMPEPAARERLKELLGELHLEREGHISVYSLPT